MTKSVLVFMKYPEPGQVKTRLAASMGSDRAAELYRCWIGDVLGVLQPLRDTTHIVGYFVGAPAEAFREWHGLADSWRPQPPGDLGQRLSAGFELGFQLGGPVLAVGTDCLEMDGDLLLAAFEDLSRHDAVFGPTPDGGYYLVGLAMPRPALFHSIRWSSPFTLADHLERCREQGWSVSLLPARHDIDTEQDWHDYLRRTERSKSGADRGSRRSDPQ